MPVCKGERCITHLVAWPVSWGEGRTTYAAENVRGLELLTFAEQDTCCGFGGTFSVKMAEISGEMVKEKVAHLMEVRPEYLIGADVSCLLNISGRLQREGQKVKVMHIAEVLMSR